MSHKGKREKADDPHAFYDYSAGVLKDTLAERLRRRPAKPMGSPRVGSNPTGVVLRVLIGDHAHKVFAMSSLPSGMEEAGGGLLFFPASCRFNNTEAHARTQAYPVCGPVA